MIINLGSRTDIPAFFSEWFYNRIDEGFLCARNPYYPEQVIKYILNPDVVDCLVFCTKNPEPMLTKIDKIKDFGQLWFVTITAYGRDIEPNVPDKKFVMQSLKKLSDIIGCEKVVWRYDPIIISETYSVETHINIFNDMACELSGYTKECVISFIDLYEKTKKNFKGISEVSEQDKHKLAKEFSKIGAKNNILVKTCAEGNTYSTYDIDTDGCITQKVLERAIGRQLKLPRITQARKECKCILGNDVGAYNTCLHGCLYCYANYDIKTVKNNFKHHNPKSPFLIGSFSDNDVIKEAEQISYIDRQIKLF